MVKTYSFKKTVGPITFGRLEDLPDAALCLRHATTCRTCRADSASQTSPY